MQPLSTPPLPEDFREGISELDVIIWTSSLDWHFTFVSAGAERILGYPAQQWLTDSNFWIGHLHPDDRARAIQEHQAAIGQTGDSKIEYRMLAADGSSVWLSETVHLLKGDCTGSRQLLGIALNITASKLEEQTVREQQLRYEQMAENIQELFWMIEVPSQQAIYVNAAFKTITGYTPDSLLQSPLSYREIIHPDDRSWVLAQLTAAQQTGNFAETFRIVRADGATRWVSVRGFPVRDQQGAIYRLAGVVQDITARREAELALSESEDRYRDLVEHSEDLLCTHDLQGRLLSCNPAPARLLGYSLEELLRISLPQLLAPEVRGLFASYLERIQRDGFAEGVMVLLTRSGEHRYWQYRNTLRADTVPIVRGMAHDVTERLRAERELRKSEERFRVAVKNSHIMVCTQNTSLQYTWVYNPVLAWAEGDCLGKTDDDLLHPEDAYRLKALKQWVLDCASGSRSGIQITVAGRKYYLDLTIEPLVDCHGAVAGITCAATDVTELHDKAERLQLLLEINAALMSKLEFAELLPVLSSCTHRLFKQDFLSMSVCDSRQAIVANYPLDTGSLALWSAESAIPMAKSLCGRALATGKIELFGRAAIHGADSEFLSCSTGQPLQSLACIPIETSRGRLATLNLGSKQENAFSAADFYLMQQLGSVVSAAMNNADAFNAVRQLSERLRKEKAYLEEELQAGDFNDMVGESPVFKEARMRAEAVAQAGSTVVLYGENGVGKELFARAIHRLSGRGQRTFIKFSCAATPKERMDCELFGSEREDPAVADAITVGRLELADHSTLFLEQVTDLTPELQQKLLRVLEEHEFQRAGGDNSIPIDVRLIVSTTEDLEQLAHEGAFRSDLYYKLNIFPIRIPALRERRSDIALLAQYFVKKHSCRMQRSVPTIPSETLSALTDWDWPGNTRELENFMERSVILTRGSQLEAPLWELSWAKGQPLSEVVAKVEREHIIRTLQDTGGAIGGPAGAAARLGIKPTALRSKIQRLGIAGAGGR